MRDLLKSINWKTFLIGVICGVLISLSLVGFKRNRYAIVTDKSGYVIRLDKWTGRTWLSFPALYYEYYFQDRGFPQEGWWVALLGQEDLELIMKQAAKEVIEEDRARAKKAK